MPLALLGAAVVYAFRPSWLARPLGELATEVGLRPEVPSRLRRRLLEPLEALVAEATRRGRRRQAPPSREGAADAEALTALLDVTTDIIESLGGIRRRALQDRLAQACIRMRREHGLTVRRFARAIATPERTLRTWIQRREAPAAPAPPPTPKPRPRRDRKRGAFDLAVTVPGIQVMADTTDFELFSVPLKLVAVQDPGARHQRLWESCRISVQESSKLIIDALADALSNRPGMQAATDQGTPYLAAATLAAIEALEAEHAPQREATPTAKAPLERSFLTVKDALAPLVEVSRAMAKAWPALQHPELASAVAKLLVATFLNVYLQARRTAPCQPSPADAALYEELAEAQRERARATDRSVKLTLQRIHDDYDFPGSRTRFVRSLRRHRVEDIIEAEACMGTRACRCYARACDRYFVAILNRVARERGDWRRARREERAASRARQADVAAHQARCEQLRDLPEEAIAAAIDRIASQWRVLGDRLGPLVHAPLSRALEHLAGIEPAPGLVDRARAGLQRWVLRQRHHDAALFAQVTRVFENALANAGGRTQAAQPSLTRQSMESMIQPTPSRRPRAAQALRI